eukprot:TRINITY_DN34715_c0_g1_i1.p1 TRINITY_DN34715_c0_g1~~TRINITY_DN34715_c0_g1_i1.p1  ORF type:complete len:449 (-),score=125.26 TRINITY_DN34715_c0_g1_i1:346-1692(-)
MADGRWQIRLRGKWVDAGAEDQAWLESGFQSKEAQVHYVSRGQAYTADLARGVQMDQYGKERPIRRFVQMETDVADDLRWQVRDETQRQVAGRLGLNASSVADASTILQGATPDASLRADLALVTFFARWQQVERSEHPEALLRRFDVLACPCEMEYGKEFLPVCESPRPRFWVHHVVALNIGESAHAADYEAYVDLRSGGLDEAAYLSDMRQIFANLFEAQVRSGALHSVLVPIGMGAFLRHIAKNDAKYNLPDCLANLRFEIAVALFKAATPFVAGGGGRQALRLHLCIAGDGTEEQGEADVNRQALLAAKQEAGLTDAQAQVWEDEDASVVSSLLAKEWWESNGRPAAPAIAPVSLANGANAKLLGNHWFGNGARRAIDENIHRRAPLLAAISLLLNGGSRCIARSPTSLEEAVLRYGGKREHLGQQGGGQAASPAVSGGPATAP